MEHSDAITTMAAERYTLGDMPAADRDAFEEHFFDCAECAASVRDGATIASATRALKNEPARKTRASWWAIAAAVALFSILGYQNLVTIPALRNASTVRSAHVLHPASFLSSGSRGGSIPEIVAAPGEDISFYFDVPPQTAPASSFVAEVVDSKGVVRTTVPFSSEDARESVLLSVPTRELAAGNCELVVMPAGPTGAAIARFPFALKFR
jgi:hypothetical protein